MTEYETLMLRAQQVMSNHLCNLVVNTIRKASYETVDNESSVDRENRLKNLGQVADYHQTLQMHLNNKIDSSLGPYLVQDNAANDDNSSNTTEH